MGKEQANRFKNRRIAFARQIDGASIRGRLADDALYLEITRLAVEEYGVSPAVIQGAERGKVLEAIIEELNANNAPTIQ